MEQTPSSRRLAAVHRSIRAVPQGAFPRAKMRSSGRYARRGLGTLWSKRRPAGVWQKSTGLLHLMVRVPPGTIKKQVVPFGDDLLFGTPEGTRTPNPRNRNPMLYPLSHWRIHLKCLAIIADKAGFVKSQMAKKSLRVRVHPERTGVTPLPGRCAHRPAASGRRCWGRPSSGPGRSCSWGR